MKKIMELDFMAFDLALFLDTHPNDVNAIETYNKVVAEGKHVRNEYEKNFGPICHAKAAEGGKWAWICEPWPWECEANIDIRGGE